MFLKALKTCWATQQKSGFTLSFACNVCEAEKPLVSAQNFAWLHREHRVAWDRRGCWDIKLFPTAVPVNSQGVEA